MNINTEKQPTDLNLETKKVTSQENLAPSSICMS